MAAIIAADIIGLRASVTYLASLRDVAIRAEADYTADT
jgi:hypothetical protein